MPRRKGVRITLLVEDRPLERFARAVLLVLGFHPREIKVEIHPSGQGSAKQWVEQQYPKEVQAYRSRASYQQIALLVGTDADEQAVTYRFGRLAEMLAAEGLDDRTDTEQIAIWAPKWNIETWILYLSGENVDEEANYRNRLGTPDYRAVARSFVERLRRPRNQDSAALPSLKVAFKETLRLEEGAGGHR